MKCHQPAETLASAGREKGRQIRYFCESRFGLEGGSVPYVVNTVAPIPRPVSELISGLFFGLGEPLFWGSIGRLFAELSPRSRLLGRQHSVPGAPFSFPALNPFFPGAGPGFMRHRHAHALHERSIFIEQILGGRRHIDVDVHSVNPIGQIVFHQPQASNFVESGAVSRACAYMCQGIHIRMQESLLQCFLQKVAAITAKLVKICFDYWEGGIPQDINREGDIPLLFGQACCWYVKRVCVATLSSRSGQ